MQELWPKTKRTRHLHIVVGHPLGLGAGAGAPPAVEAQQHEDPWSSVALCEELGLLDQNPRNSIATCLLKQCRPGHQQLQDFVLLALVRGLLEQHRCTLTR